MKTFSPSMVLRPTLIAMAVLAMCASAQAQNTSNEAQVTVGAAVNDGSASDRAQMAQYSDLHSERRTAAQLDVEVTQRDESAHRWLDVRGSDLLRDNRDLSVVWKNPGEWAVRADVHGLVHYDPNTIRSPGGSEAELRVKRTSVGLGMSQWITDGMQVEVDLKSEKKQGTRLFGIGMTCPSPIAPGCGVTTGTNVGWATLLLPEPVDANHTQVEARLSYALDKLRMSVGYYGSFYRNDNASLRANVPGSLYNAVGELLPLSGGLQSILSQPVALAPDNQAQQLDLSGNYSLANTTQATFKFSYARATQDQSFAGAGFVGAPTNVSSLGAEVVTRLARLGLQSRPLAPLSLTGEWRYEERQDNTPLAAYNVVGASSWTNVKLPYEKTNGKLQAAWQFDSSYRVSAGADFEGIQRGAFTPSSAVYGVSALRQNTQENTLFAELRKRMTGNFSGAITLSNSQRDGSNWLRPNGGLGVSEVLNPNDPAWGFSSSAVFMPTLANRDRNKARLYAEWQPSDALAIQFAAEGGNDRFKTPVSNGLRDTHMDQFTLDASYALSYAWNFNAYLSKAMQTYNQVRPAGYVMAFGNTNVGAGLGFTGKIDSSFDIGGTLSFVSDRSVYQQTLDAQAGSDSVALLAASGGLPDITIRQTSLKLFGKYAIDKKSSVRVDAVWQRATSNDWTWGYNGVPYTYSDGSTVTQKAVQQAAYIRVNYTYVFSK